MDLTLREKFMRVFVDILSFCPGIGRFLIKVFNIKFTFRTKLYLSEYIRAKEKGEDITQLPKAEGLLRKIQLANLAILKELDRVCRENGLKYCLAYGTQLGATRHKGYIPWDDDIDVAMMRDDYEKIQEIFEARTHNTDLCVRMIKNKHHPGMLILKIKHKNLPFLFIDIFPWDYYHTALDEEERKKINTKIIDERRNVNSDKSLLDLSVSDLYNYIRVYTKTHILENKQPEENQKNDIFMGLDFPHAGKIQIMSYDDVFPLEDVEFEGCKLMQMKNPDVHLKGWFGNYMEYPRELFLGHFQNQIISKKEYMLLDKFIEEEKV